LSHLESRAFEDYFKGNRNIEERSDERFQYRNKYFMHMMSNNSTTKKKIEPMENDKSKEAEEGKKELPKENDANGLKQPQIRTVLRTPNEIKEQRLQNHLINNYVIGNKKALLKTMALYYKKNHDFVFNHLPYTFHIQKGLEDENYFRFLRFYQQRGREARARGTDDNVWIVKPGEFSNRGQGIRVCKTLDEVKSIINNKMREKTINGSEHTYIVQAYIEKPLLYNRRKFDLRHYMMITCVNGILKGYWYREGYVRTTSSEYSLITKDGAVHLTNDAVQK
jgi:hypothetical protein